MIVPFLAYFSSSSTDEQIQNSSAFVPTFSYFVGAAKDEIQRNLIYGKLMDIIIHLGDTGFVEKQEFKGMSANIFEAVQKILTTKWNKT